MTRHPDGADTRPAPSHRMNNGSPSGEHLANPRPHPTVAPSLPQLLLVELDPGPGEQLPELVLVRPRPVVLLLVGDVPAHRAQARVADRERPVPGLPPEPAGRRERLVDPGRRLRLHDPE